ncbi:unnamed protein product [Thlaspi arvense]|uniref:SCP domain-containing protein n=1 Tax=Thlaspi arvense TaxID=13288 RepID=A0AAU9T0F0_THLAR|nr:unnamed protein product [Thlaspi arvense]
MSSSLRHPFFLFTSSVFLLLLFSGDVPSAVGTISPDVSNATARARNRARKNRESMEFLNAHNIARVASGALNLKWDKGLVHFADNWAKQRKSDCKMTHSGGPYGENIFWYQRSENWSPAKVVAKWMDERLNYNRITNTCTPGKMCGHYTQIVWRTTTAVGCTIAKCSNNRGFLVICEYSPSGNYEGESPFD